jgi:carbonic anhydrase/acetyltransferase-like protein (isoleucine patch superfamily)
VRDRRGRLHPDRGKFIVLENAVIRSTMRHLTRIGDYCLVGPNAHLAGCTVQNEVFIATGAAIFHGAFLGARSEIRINGVVHLKTKLPNDTIVSIGWVAVGDPATLLPPDEHEKIWAMQKPLNFPLAVYGIDRSEASMKKVTDRMAQMLASHTEDQELA